MKTGLIYTMSFAFVMFLGFVSVMMVDYYADGCIVDYDKVITRKMPDGSYVSTNGEMCHQMIIRTLQGDRRRTY